MFGPQQSCKLSMVGVPRNGDEDPYRISRVGVSFTFWPEKTEAVVLTTAARGCFCERCSNAISSASRVLRETFVRLYGPHWDLGTEKDLFYHRVIANYMENSDVLFGSVEHLYETEVREVSATLLEIARRKNSGKPN
jgi:hypothetical protein